MIWCIHKKFKDHPELAAKLVAIDEEIFEDNSWGDTYWGQCNGVGNNWLGIILMEERDKLRASS